MQLETIKRINFKRFFLLSLPFLCVALFLSKSGMEIFAISINYIATIIYLVMFSEAVILLTNQYVPGREKVGKGYLVFLFVGKLVILISALIFGVQIMGSRIIIPLINYIIHIFVLGASFKKKE